MQVKAPHAVASAQALTSRIPAHTATAVTDGSTTRVALQHCSTEACDGVTCVTRSPLASLPDVSTARCLRAQQRKRRRSRRTRPALAPADAAGTTDAELDQISPRLQYDGRVRAFCFVSAARSNVRPRKPLQPPHRPRPHALVTKPRHRPVSSTSKARRSQRARARPWLRQNCRNGQCSGLRHAAVQGAQRLVQQSAR